MSQCHYDEGILICRGVVNVVRHHLCEVCVVKCVGAGYVWGYIMWCRVWNKVKCVDT